MVQERLQRIAFDAPVSSHDRRFLRAPPCAHVGACLESASLRRLWVEMAALFGALAQVVACSTSNSGSPSSSSASPSSSDAATTSSSSSGVDAAATGPDATVTGLAEAGAASDGALLETSASPDGASDATASGSPNTVTVSAGTAACVVLSGGTVKCWGSNESGELGIDATTGPDTCGSGLPCSITPRALESLSGVTVVSAGYQAACAILSGGTVKCWGDNVDGELGEGTTSGPESCYAGPCSASPVALAGLSGVTGISVGQGTPLCALLTGGTVECWGLNSEGDVGDEMACDAGVCPSPPSMVAGLTGVTAVSAGGAFACALLSTGTVQCWGDNTYATLGYGMTTGPSTCYYGEHPCALAPVAVVGLSNVTAISAGGDVACALISDGTVKCWGDNQFGELGIGTTTGPDTCFPSTATTGYSCSATPVAVMGVTGAVAISVGDYLVCALLSDGTVDCWGNNSSPTPSPVPGLTGIAAISAGAGFACAVSSGGTVECWGSNSYGILGDGGAANDRSSPVAVKL
jgi:alpha-tubulin suppressor-like RCC1 family protein